MAPSAAEVISHSITKWATENALKIAEIADKYSWEGWAQIEIAFALHRDMAILAAAETDTMYSVEREVRIWEDSALSKDDQRVDILVELSRDNAVSPFDAIELKCLGSEYLENFFGKRAMSDVAKLKNSRMRERYYRDRGCNLWMAALAVLRDHRAYKLPEGFSDYRIPVVCDGKAYVVVIAVWRARLDGQGTLRSFE